LTDALGASGDADFGHVNVAIFHEGQASGTWAADGTTLTLNARAERGESRPRRVGGRRAVRAGWVDGLSPGRGRVAAVPGAGVAGDRAEPDRIRRESMVVGRRWAQPCRATGDASSATEDITKAVLAAVPSSSIVPSSSTAVRLTVLGGVSGSPELPVAGLAR
jgi:hypothetical protein